MVDTVEKLGARLDAINDGRLRTALVDDNTSLLEENAVKAAEAKRRAEEGSVDKAISASLGEVAQKVGVEAAIRFDAARKGVEEAQGFLDTATTIRDEITKRSERFNSPDFNMREDPALFAVAKEDIESRGLYRQGREAQELLASTSWYDYSLTLEKIDDSHRRMQDIQDAGPSGMVAAFAAGMFDMNIPVFTQLSKARRIGKLQDRLSNAVSSNAISKAQADLVARSTTRAENIGIGVTTGALATGGTEALNVALDPTLDSRDVVMATVMGAGFGGTLGSLFRGNRDAIIEDIVTSNIIEKTAKLPEMDLAQSVGSGRIKSDAVRTTESSDSVFAEVEEMFNENPEADAAYRAFEDAGFISEGAGPIQSTVQKYAQKVYEGINKTPFVSDYARGARDAGIIGRGLAFKMLEDPLGIVRNNRSADATATRLYDTVAPMYSLNAPLHKKQWMRDNGIKSLSRAGFAADLTFGKEVMKYRAAVHAGRPEPRDVHPSVKAASEEIDQAFETALMHNKKYGVEGFEDVEYIKGHTPTRWLGEKINRIEQATGTEAIVKALVRGIKSKAPDLEDALADVYAKAIMRSAKNRDLGNPTAALMTVGADGRAALERTLQDMGVEESLGLSAADVTDRILFKNTERGTAKASRRKIPMDMTTPIEGTEYTLLDLVDNDLYALMDGTIRGQSNLAGLSSVGIQQRDMSKWQEAARDEAAALGTDPEKAAKWVEQMFSYFGENAFVGGTTQATSMINKLAILSYLPQLGITQLAEVGTTLGVVGLRSWSHYAGKSMHGMVKHMDSEVAKSLHSISGFVGDHRGFVRTDNLDDANLAGGSTLLRNTQYAMDKGLRGLGHLSGFYKVNEWLHTVAGLAMNDYMVRQIKAGVDSPRLRSMGVDSEFRTIIQKKLDDGSIKFTEDGHVKDMGTENWDADDLDLLKVITRRNMDQTVQKPRRGDAHAWQYTDLGALFSSLRSFVFTAAQKQMLHNARLADPEAFQMLLATTLTAGVAYSAKEVVNGRGDDLDVEKIAKGAINWSSLISPALMAVEPIAYMAGADKIPGSPLPMNGWRYGNSGIISLPPGLQAINQLAHLPRIPVDLLEDGTLDRTSENALKAIPILGRSMVTPALMELIEQDMEAAASK